MTPALDTTNNFIRPIVRTINRRASFEAKSVVEGDHPAILAKLSMLNRSTTVSVPVKLLVAAQNTPMERDRLRGLIKRRLDRLMFRPAPISNSKMTRLAVAADGSGRPPYGGGRGRR